MILIWSRHAELFPYVTVIVGEENTEVDFLKGSVVEKEKRREGGEVFWSVQV